MLKIILALNLLIFYLKEGYTQIPGTDYDKKNPFEIQLEQQKISKDSIVYKIIDRNIADWDNVLTVIDWTSSMHEYGLQLFIWLELHEKQRQRFRKFVFFNDGDDKISAEKVTGFTGGIYCSEDNSTKQALELMQTVAQNGTGGDEQENDVEALIEGIKQCLDCEDIILIADSKSMVRDVALLPDLINLCKTQNRRIHVILAGNEPNVFMEYLIIAYQTGGSLHTLEEDIEDLKTKMENRKKIKIGNKTYQINKGILEEKIINK